MQNKYNKCLCMANGHLVFRVYMGPYDCEVFFYSCEQRPHQGFCLSFCPPVLTRTGDLPLGTARI